MSLLALQWFLGAVAALLGVAAIFTFVRVRRLARRVERLAESYWELRYEQSQLSARLARLEGSTGDGQPMAPGGATAFVPLSSLKKM
jgi:hypothetical protein